MKAVLIFNKSSDLSFVASDVEFKRHLHKQAIQAGLVQEDADMAARIDTDVVMQMFSPLVVSQRAMVDTLHNPYNTVTCQNGMQFVFQQFEECMYMAVGGSADSESFLNRQLLVLHSILTFLHGPCTEQVYPDNTALRDQRRGLVTRLLNTWCKLYNEEQSFLVEAVERLHVGVNHVLNSHCIQLLEASLTCLKAAGEKDAVHAMFVVNSKLLSLFSSRNATELNSADILLIILLVNATFPHEHEDVGGSVSSGLGSLNLSPRRQLSFTSSFSPFASLPVKRNSPRMAASNTATTHQTHRSMPLMGSMRIDAPVTSGADLHRHGTTAPSGEESGEDQRSRESTSETQDSSDVENSSSPATSSLSFQGSMIVIQEEQGSSSRTSGTDASYPTMVEETRTGTSRGEAESTDSENLRIPNADDSVLELTLENTEVGQDVLSCDEAELSDAGGGAYEILGTQLVTRQSFMAALQSGGCAYSPHTLHCVEVMPGTVAIIICEKPRKKFAPLVTELLGLITAVLAASWAQVGIKSGKQLQDSVDTRLKKLNSMMRKLKNPGHIERLVREIQSAWDLLRGPELQKYVDVGELGTMPPRMETMASNVLLKVKDLYCALYLTSRRATQDEDRIRRAVEQLQSNFSQQLLDYKDYLAVKAQRNITMTTYHRYFPGLVHFMYINRKTAQLTVPSINLPLQLEERSMDLSNIIKQQIWQIVPWIQSRLSQGYTSVIVRKGDFAFTYCLWFEDPMGNALAVQHPYRGADNNLLPGVLTGDFYRELVKQCFFPPQQKVAQCYELFCMHVGTAPTPYILRQCRKLATSLWGSSGEASSPISLL